MIRLALLATMLLSVGAAQAGTLEQVRQRGFVECGVRSDAANPAASRKPTGWAGMERDFCRAVAAAVLGGPEKFRAVPLSSETRFAALQSGEIDLLSYPSAWTFSNDTNGAARFVGVFYYEAQGFMVRRRLGVTSALELSGADICAGDDKAVEVNLAEYFRQHNMPYTLISLETPSEALKAYENGRCDAYVGSLAHLKAHKADLATPSDHMVLPDIIALEPFGPAVRRGDERWLAIVRWTLFALISAEELGLHSNTIDGLRRAESPLVQRFLGTEQDMGAQIGLDADWAYNIVKTVGNYGEIFARNVGTNSPLGLERDHNRLWSEGGLLDAPPIR